MSDQLALEIWETEGGSVLTLPPVTPEELRDGKRRRWHIMWTDAIEMLERWDCE